MKDHMKEVEQAFREDHPELKGSLEELIALTSAARGIVNHRSPSQIVVQHTGGDRVAVSVASAVICVLAVFVLTMLYIDQSRKIDRLYDHLSAIYMQAPNLKPSEESK